MTGIKALTIAVALLTLTVLLNAFVHFNLVWILVLGTTAWAAIDSAKLDLKKYKTGIAYGPVVLFIAVALAWIIGFPWYLVVRHQIKAGTLPLKQPAPQAPAASSS